VTTSGGDAATALARLDEITRRLRAECPWDREQDERSIVPHTVEEAYELADAVNSGDDSKLLDELGDFLFQAHFLALLLEERGAGDLAQVAEGMIAKLIRRHPHVFEESEARELLAGSDPETGREVLANWDRIKREVEGRGADDPFADVPENLPGLLYARKLLRRSEAEGEARRRGSAVVEAADSDPDSGRERIADDEARERAEAWLGDLLLELVRIARRLGVDPELAVRAAARRAVLPE
jgi:ATP diphosphatase